MQSARRLIVLSTTLFLLTALPAFAAPGAVDVPSECTIVDTDGVSHAYSGQYLGICALETARIQGIVSAYTLQNFSFGLFLQSLNGIVPGETEYWALYHNGVSASVGLTDLAVAQGDVLKFQLTDWSSNTDIGSPIEFSIGSLIAAQNTPSPSPSGGGGEFLEERHFNVESAFDFLVAKQSADGSFGSPMLTDWAAIAFGAATDEVCNDACPAAREKLRLYLRSAESELSSITDFERHAMALEALGIDPYSETPEDYIAPIAAAFDGTQIGDASLVNDDIFAVFPLLNAGYSNTDPMMNAIATFILSKQKVNGSWEDSVDLTAAAIQALASFSDEKTNAAIKKAEEFLRRNQNESGIFSSNSFSLSWALQAIAALGQTPNDWKKSGLTPLGHLGVFQQQDGGVEPSTASEESRIWATSYAIPAAFGKPWDAILKNFSRPMPTMIATVPETYPTTTVETAQILGNEPFPRIHEPFPIEPSSATSAEMKSSIEDSTPLQAAAAAQSTPTPNSMWFWITGLLLAFGATFYFLSRRA